MGFMRVKLAGRGRKRVVILLEFVLLSTLLPAQQGDYTFHARTEMVLVNVTVRDKSGRLVRDLKPSDFVLQEDGKAQKIASFDVENTDAIFPAEVTQAKVLSAAPPSTKEEPPSAAEAQEPFKDRRL